MSAKRPFVSVIVPVYNDPSGVRTTLESLVEQTYPRGAYEVVVVDNDSTDGTLTAARKIAAVNPELVRVERETEIQGSCAEHGHSRVLGRDRGVRRRRRSGWSRVARGGRRGDDRA